MFICGKIKQLGDSAGGIVMSKKIRIGIVFISISILLSLSGCGRSAKQEDSNSVDNAENINTAETDMSEAANVIIMHHLLHREIGLFMCMKKILST